MGTTTDNCDCERLPRRAIPWLRVVKLLLTIATLALGIWSSIELF